MIRSKYRCFPPLFVAVVTALAVWSAMDRPSSIGGIAYAVASGVLVAAIGHVALTRVTRPSRDEP